MKDRLKEHMEGWRFCEKCGMKFYQKMDGCCGTIRLKCPRCNTILCIDLFTHDAMRFFSNISHFLQLTWLFSIYTLLYSTIPLTTQLLSQSSAITAISLTRLFHI